MSAADGEKRKTLEKWAFRGVCPSSFPERTKRRWWRRMLKKMRERVEGMRAKAKDGKMRGKSA